MDDPTEYRGRRLPRVAYYLSFCGGVLTLPSSFVMILTANYGSGLLAVLSLSTFGAGLLIILAALTFGRSPEEDSRFQAFVFALSFASATAVIGSGILYESLWLLSGPFLGFVGSVSFFVGKRVSFFW